MEQIGEVKYGKALTWNELADLYPGRARIMPMDVVFQWAKRQAHTFYVHPEKETIHLINRGAKWNR